MSSPTEETIKLVLETAGFQSLDEAVESLRALKRETGELSREQEQAAALLSYYQTAVRDVGTAEAAAADQALEEARARKIASGMLAEQRERTLGLVDAQEALGTTTTTTATATGGMGRGVLQASFAVQDFTSVLTGGGGLSRALTSVQNNIPILLTGLGMGAGLAGTVSLVSVGLGAMIPLLTQSGEEAEKAAAKIEEYADQADRIKGEKTQGEAEVHKTIAEATRGQGQEIYSGILRSIQRSEQGAKTPEERALLDQIGPGLGGLGALLHPVLLTRAISSRINRPEAQRQRADELLATFRSDPGARGQLAAMAAAHPEDFPADLA